MFDIEEKTMTGSAISYTIPDNVHSIALHAVDGDINMSTTSSGDVWTLVSGDKEAIDTRTLAGETIYFNGENGKKLQIRLLKGLLS